MQGHETRTSKRSGRYLLHIWMLQEKPQQWWPFILIIQYKPISWIVALCQKLAEGSGSISINISLASMAFWKLSSPAMRSVSLVPSLVPCSMCHPGYGHVTRHWHLLLKVTAPLIILPAEWQVLECLLASAWPPGIQLSSLSDTVDVFFSEEAW